MSGTLRGALRRIGAWFACNKRPANARRAWLMAVGCKAGLNEYHCPCGRCDLPVIPPAMKDRGRPSEVIGRMGTSGYLHSYCDESTDSGHSSASGLTSYP